MGKESLSFTDLGQTNLPGAASEGLAQARNDLNLSPPPKNTWGYHVNLRLPSMKRTRPPSFRWLKRKLLVLCSTTLKPQVSLGGKKYPLFIFMGRKTLRSITMGELSRKPSTHGPEGRRSVSSSCFIRFLCAIRSFRGILKRYSDFRIPLPKSVESVT